MATPEADEPQWKTILRQCLPADCPLLAVVVGSLDPTDDISDMSSPRNAAVWHQAVERYLAHLNNELDSIATERDRIAAERDILRAAITPAAAKGAAHRADKQRTRTSSAQKRRTRKSASWST